MNIQGIYEFKIKIPTMFNTYELNIKDHNLITTKGFEWFINRWLSNDFRSIGEIAFGKSTNEYPTIDTLHLTDEVIIPYKDTDVKVKGTSISLSANISGETINDTTEIGVYTYNEKGLDNILLSQDIHDKYNVPTTSTVTINYTFTVTNYETEQIGEEELDD